VKLIDDNSLEWLPHGLGLGGGPLGNLFVPLDDDTAASTIDAAWKTGVRYFDTAPHYGLGLSEARLGEVLATKPRSEYVLSTKVGRVLVPNEHGADDWDDEGFAVRATHRRVFDFSERGVRQSLEDSLTRLGIDTVDIVYLHDPENDLQQAVDQGGPALERMRAEGLCRAIGVGSTDNAAIRSIVQRCDVDVAMVAGTMTLLDQSGLEDVLPLCREHGVSIVAAGVFNSGILAADDPIDGMFAYAAAPDPVVRRVRALSDICARNGVSLRSAAMAFPERFGGAASVCVGVRTPEEMTSNAKAWAVEIPDQCWTQLLDSGLVEIGPQPYDLSPASSTNGSTQP
jgi:D-threo-aldose 1-dehydrogenase